jgi:hypothetical protein
MPVFTHVIHEVQCCRHAHLDPCGSGTFEPSLSNFPDRIFRV